MHSFSVLSENMTIIPYDSMYQMLHLGWIRDASLLMHFHSPRSIIAAAAVTVIIITITIIIQSN